MAHAFLRLMILELLHGNLHSSLQLWEMKMPSCLKALIRKWAWNGIVLSWVRDNLFLTIKLSWVEVCINILSTTSKQVFVCFFLVKIHKLLGSSFQITGPFWKFILWPFCLCLLFLDGSLEVSLPGQAKNNIRSTHMGWVEHGVTFSDMGLPGLSPHSILYCLDSSWDPLPPCQREIILLCSSQCGYEH